jgi:hypothetical protein
LTRLKSFFKAQSTFFIIDLKLSKLFREILRKSKLVLIPFLETRILLHLLIDIPFLDEEKGNQTLKDLTNCIVNQWYTQNYNWNAKTIISGIKELRKLVLFDYKINGSFVKFNDGVIKWDLKVTVI